MITPMMEKAAEAVWAELRRQAEADGPDAPWVDREIGVIDGRVDMERLVRAMFDVIREEIEAGALAGAEQAVEHGSDAAQHAVDALRQVVDLLDTGKT